MTHGVVYTMAKVMVSMGKSTVGRMTFAQEIELSEEKTGS